MGWLSGWDKRIKLNTDNTKIDVALTCFPVTVFLTSTQGEEVFTELDADTDYMKVAFTKADGTTQLYAECELFNVSESVGIYHVSKSDWAISDSVDTDFYMYYDNDHADNTTYIGSSGTAAASNVWDDNFKAVYHLADSEAPAVSINDLGSKFTADDIMDGEGNLFEDCAVIKAEDGKFYLFFDGWGIDPTSNDDIYCVRSDTATFDDYVNLGKVITKADIRVGAVVYDPVREEYIMYITERGGAGEDEVRAYYIAETDFPDGDVWTDAGVILSLGAGGQWDDHRVSAMGTTPKIDGQYTLLYQGRGGAAEIRYHGLAYSDDPRGSFTKDDNNPLFQNSTFGTSVPAAESDFYGRFDIRAVLELAEGYLMFYETEVGAAGYWKVGVLYTPDKTFTHAYQGVNCPLFTTGNVSWANPTTILTEGATTYLYINASSADLYSSFFHLHVVEITVGAYTDTVTIADSTANNNRSFKKGIDEPAMATGKVGKGQDFDGSNDYVTAPDVWDAPTEITCEMIGKADDTSAEYRAFSFDIDQYAYFRFNSGAVANLLRANVGGSTSSYSDTHTLTNYNYMALTAKENQADTGFNVYVNDSLVHAVTQGAFLANEGNNNIIGANRNFNDQFFKGIIDEVRISQSIRTAAWTKGTYNSLWDTLLTYGSEKVQIDALFFGSNF